MAGRWAIAGAAASLVVAAVSPPAIAQTRLGIPALLPTGGAIAIEADRLPRYRVTVLKHPDRLVVDVLDATYPGATARVGVPVGSPIGAVRLARRDRSTVRIVFELARPATLTHHVERLAGNRHRLVVAWAEPAPMAPAAGPVVFDARLVEGQVRLMTSRPVLGRVQPLEAGSGYRILLEGARLDPATPRLLERSRGEIRRVRLASDAAGTRLTIETERPGRLYKLAVAPTSWQFQPMLEPADAAAPTVVGVSARRPGPTLPRAGRPPAVPNGWALEAPGPVQRLVERLRAAPPAAEGLRWRPAAPDPAWTWRSHTQWLYTSNIGLVAPEEAGWGALHRYQGTFHQAVPAWRGYMMAYTEHQRLRFAEPRYDFDSMLQAVAVTHHLGGAAHAFEGGALLYRRGAYSLANDMIDTDLFAGVGLFGHLGPRAVWSATLTADRVGAATLSGSYYGQALRGRFAGPVPLGAWLQADAMLQRLDPVIIGTPSYRWYGDVGLERAIAPRARLAVQARLGGQLGPSTAWYVQGGPCLSLWF